MSLDIARLVEPEQLPGQIARVARPTSHWASAYLRRVLGIDVLAVLGASALGYLVRFDHTVVLLHPVQHLAMLGLMPVVWLASLVLFRAYETRFMGLGSEEFDRVLRASVFTLAALATFSWAFKLEIARGYVVIALPLGTAALLFMRYLLRQHLHRQRRRGHGMQQVIVVGHEQGAVDLVRQLVRSSYHGMAVAGVCLPPGVSASTDEQAALAAMGVPVLGGFDDVAEVSAREAIDAVAVLPTPELDGRALRRLAWALEETHAELYVAPAITEVFGPRLAIRPVSGLPLLHLERPQLSGLGRICKGTFDRVSAAAGIVLLAPVLLAVALAVRLDDGGPVFFRQERVGLEGRGFAMLKFRTMVVDAEARLSSLASTDEGNGVLFKMRSDPRVTRVGRVLRRLSLDELPQLFNVLVGQMSLVGPRPPLAREVAVYEHDARRKLLVKPGLTGLWQVSGRSDLDWDESVRLDLRYVENWSFALDMMILWRTLGAVVRSRGAY